MTVILDVAQPELLACCGVEYVHWAPVADYSPLQTPPKKHAVRSNRKFATPLEAIFDAYKSRKHNPPNGPELGIRGRLQRARRAIIRHAQTWEELTAVTSEEFREWRNYGPLTHMTLESIARENGHRIAAWPVKTGIKQGTDLFAALISTH